MHFTMIVLLNPATYYLCFQWWFKYAAFFLFKEWMQAWTAIIIMVLELLIVVFVKIKEHNDPVVTNVNITERRNWKEGIMY